MKNWLIFGSGLILGTVLGAYFVAYLFFDDVTKTPKTAVVTKAAPSVAPLSEVAIAKSQPKKVEPPPGAPSATPSAPSISETKPAALAAQFVDPDSLPPAEPNVISTAKRDDAAVSQPSQ